MGAAELMSLKNEQAELKRYIEIILSATERARDLNSKLLTFSRKTKMTSTPIAVNPIVDDAIGLLRHSIDKRIELSADHVDSDSHIIGDPSEFHSALINLGINARDALPEGGEIIFRVKRITLDQYIHDSLNRELKPGDYISISVIDNGVGIPADLHESIFEPFFTTKDVGKGTGLGLAAVYGTIRQHRGGIQLTSVVGEGTTVELLVPAITVTEPVTEQSRQLQRMTNQDKTILIIDDEEMIRAMASSMLEELGYKTLIANSGVKALDLLSEQADQIDGILLDYTMPDHTGEEVFIEIKRHYPNLKVVMGSGFVGEQTMDRLQSYGLEYFLAKPYNMSQLKEIFDTALKGSIQQSKDQ
jgi:CheY-like chemotaxis protein